MVKQIVTVGLALALMLSVVSCSEATSPADGQSRTPTSSEDFEGQNYKDVVDALNEAGFTNVKTTALGDLITGWLKKPDTVEKVEIDGVASFEKGDIANSDDEVFVSYHSFPDSGEDQAEVAPTMDPGEPADDRETIWRGWEEAQVEFRLGEAAPFIATAGNGPNIPLSFTVTPPTAFTPADPANSTQAATIYFTVTITNLSDTETWDPDFLLPSVISDGIEGDQIYSSDDGMLWTNAQKVLPGQSMTIKDGWSVANTNDATYKLDIDGMAGYTIYFTK